MTPWDYTQPESDDITWGTVNTGSTNMTCSPKSKEALSEAALYTHPVCGNKPRGALGFLSKLPQA